MGKNGQALLLTLHKIIFPRILYKAMNKLLVVLSGFVLMSLVVGVPEPATMLLFGLGLLGLAGVYRRKQ